MAYSATFSAYELLVAQKGSLRPKLQSLSNDLFPSGGPEPKSLVEITGTSNSGKTILLAEIIAFTILPTYFNGKDSSVVFVDLDHKFSVQHLKKVAEKIIAQSGEKNTQDDVQFTIELRLQSLQILNCYTAEQFEVALETIEDLLIENHDIALVAIDNIGAFYWEDVDKKRIKKEAHYSNLVERLSCICKKHNIVCAYTVNSNYVLPKGRGPNVDYYFEMKGVQSTDEGCRRNLKLVDRGFSIEKVVCIDGSGMHFIKLEDVRSSDG